MFLNEIVNRENISFRRLTGYSAFRCFFNVSAVYFTRAQNKIALFETNRVNGIRIIGYTFCWLAVKKTPKLVRASKPILSAKKLQSLANFKEFHEIVALL